ncbi:MAG: type I 3-dehydroquinate dehydratase [Kiritimatiellaeota bacterium]|nr:type I 3-dehydroquinate dehydratase [Kiritimatiellota bacterium]
MKSAFQKVSVSKPWKNNLAAFPSLGKRPLVVGVITSFAEATTALKLKKKPFDLVEWRLDLTGLGAGRGRWLERCHKLEQAGVRVLLTIRSSDEGGKWSGGDEERLTLYRRGLEVISMVDVEINSRLLPRVVAAAHNIGKPVVGSFHDFSETPPTSVLEENMVRGWKAGADVVKLATKLKAETDLPLLLKLLARGTPQRPLCVIGMGAPKARLALAWAGSCFAYGFLGKSAAPGQVSCSTLWSQLQTGADERM